MQILNIQQGSDEALSCICYEHGLKRGIFLK